ncbi:MAG TPA: alpha-amylase family glycosyl hydrolase, partial [Verrucomicrobiota bacterium]|nr:alpha-amylase family glycosyl hydrolase [Verrucomicrobiota bacterium]
HPIGETLRKGTLGSPYAVRDYYAINPDLGSADDFKRLISEAHKRDMKVIIDIVANHTAWDNVLIKSNPEFYKHDASGKIVPPVPEWTDVAGLDYSNPKMRRYMITMLQYWLKEFDLDGFRCDVAHMVPVDFWNEARVELDKTKRDIVMLAEASQPPLLTNAFDIDYSWPMLATLNNVMLHSAPASDIQRSWEESVQQFPKGSLHMRMTDNHDEARAVARYGIRGATAASVTMFMLDGVPLLYNGMEVGDATESGDPALFEKLPVFWKPKERPPLRDIYRDLIKLRKQYAALRGGQVTWLKNSNPGDLVTFMRSDDKDEFVIVVNLSNRAVSGSAEIKNSQSFKPVRISGMPEAPAGGFPNFRLNGFEWRIYHRSVPQ